MSCIRTTKSIYCSVYLLYCNMYHQAYSLSCVDHCVFTAQSIYPTVYLLSSVFIVQGINRQVYLPSCVFITKGINCPGRWVFTVLCSYSPKNCPVCLLPRVFVILCTFWSEYCIYYSECLSYSIYHSKHLLPRLFMI